MNEAYPLKTYYQGTRVCPQSSTCPFWWSAHFHASPSQINQKHQTGEFALVFITAEPNSMGEIEKTYLFVLVVLAKENQVGWWPVLVRDFDLRELVAVVHYKVLDMWIGVQFSIADFQNSFCIFDRKVRLVLLLCTTLVAVLNKLYPKAKTKERKKERSERRDKC